MVALFTAMTSSKSSPHKWLYSSVIFRHDKIGNGTLVDAILDRIIHDSYNILIDGNVSMREKQIASITLAGPKGWLRWSNQCLSSIYSILPVTI